MINKCSYVNSSIVITVVFKTDCHTFSKKRSLALKLPEPYQYSTGSDLFLIRIIFTNNIIVIIIIYLFPTK